MALKPLDYFLAKHNSARMHNKNICNKITTCVKKERSPFIYCSSYDYSNSLAHLNP